MASNDGRVVSNFITQALKSKNITIYGEGTQSRSFCYVDDLIEGLYKLFFTENIFDPVNLGNPDPITILQLAKDIIEMTASKSKLLYKDLPSDDPLTREPDITRAKMALDWTPKISRDVGLSRTVEYFKSEEISN